MPTKEKIKGDDLKEKAKSLSVVRQNYITRRTLFDQQYTNLSKYFYQTRREIGTKNTMPVQQGTVYNDGSINDSVGAKFLKDFAGIVVGMVWKNGARTFRPSPSKYIQNLTEEGKQYFEFFNTELTSAMESENSGFEVNYHTTAEEQFCFGTAGMSVQEGDLSDPLIFKNHSVLNFYLDYNAKGNVDTIYIDFAFTAKQLYEEYREVAGSAVAAAYNSQKWDQRFIVTEAIFPRTDPTATEGKLGMPFQSHLFLPVEQVYLEEGGYESLPLVEIFDTKLEYEDNGRSRCMDALPTMVQINILVEILVIGAEQQVQPAMGMYDNGSLAGRAVDLSTGALNVFNVAGTIPTEKPLFPLFTVGDLRAAFELLKFYYEQLSTYFKLDKLLDLNSSGPRMTFGEAAIRDRIRGDALAREYAQHKRFLTRLIDRSVNILFRMGLLGVADPNDVEDPKVVRLVDAGIVPTKIPQEILVVMESGLDWYDLEFFSPAAMTMKASELQSLATFMQFVQEAAGVDPAFLDSIDPDGTVKKVKDLTGTDMLVFRTEQGTKDARENRIANQSQMAQLQMQLEMAKANQSNAQAEAARAGAVSTVQGMGAPDG